MRAVLFQVHLWTGLTLGILLVLLGLSGSILVYERELLALGAKPAPLVSASGKRPPLDAFLANARAAVPSKRAAATIMLPKPGEALLVRFQRGPQQGTDVYLDPATARILETRQSPSNALVAFAHRFHGNLFIGGREGRQVVGWLGIAMLLLGLSGLVLWWPKRGRWQGAFFLRKSARGYRFHRELHGAVGIWAFAVFIAVSFSGVAIAFPESARAVLSLGTPAPVVHSAAKPSPAVRPLGAEAVLRLVQSRYPGAKIRSLSFGRGDEVRVTLGDTAILVDPRRKSVTSAASAPLDRFMAWQRPLHEGSGQGPLWRFLVFLSGLLPGLFVATGLSMWLKKRRARLTLIATQVLKGAGP